MQDAMTADELLALPWVAADCSSDLPRTAGLYCAISETGEIVYVGMSKVSIRQRWSMHHRRRVFGQMQGLRIAFWITSECDRLERVERETILHVSPTLNRLGLPFGQRTHRPRLTTCRTAKGEIHRSVNLDADMAAFIADEARAQSTSENSIVRQAVRAYMTVRLAERDAEREPERISA